MAETVYLLGAGINRVIKDRNGLQPPLATDFFQQALRLHDGGSEQYREKVKPLFLEELVLCNLSFFIFIVFLIDLFIMPIEFCASFLD